MLERWFNKIFSNNSLLLEKVKDFFAPPKHQKEYYVFGNVMISKKLFMLCFWILSLLSGVYLLVVVPEKIMECYRSKHSNKVFTKYYNSRSLNNYTGEARVVAKKSDAEYLGELSNGVATGKGYLYDKSGKIVYNGEFVNNQYSGAGTLYYDNGKIQYIGFFTQNKFNGDGKLYDVNGKLSYQGEFVDGLKMGKGSLFNSFGTLIFEGTFLNDMPLLEKYLGRGMRDTSSAFLEDAVIYNFDQSACVIYKDLGVMIVTAGDENTIEGKQIINKIYVLNNKYFGAEQKLKKDEIDQKIDELGGTKSYSGYTRVVFDEMSAIDYLRKKEENVCLNLSEYSFDSQYSDVFEARKRKSNDKVYVQSYKFNDLEYTYYFGDKYSQYIFYSIERVS